MAVAYVIAFFVMLAVLGWRPDPPHRKKTEAPAPMERVIEATARP